MGSNATPFPGSTTTKGLAFFMTYNLETNAITFLQTKQDAIYRDMDRGALTGDAISDTISFSCSKTNGLTGLHWTFAPEFSGLCGISTKKDGNAMLPMRGHRVFRYGLNDQPTAKLFVCGDHDGTGVITYDGFVDPQIPVTVGPRSYCAHWLQNDQKIVDYAHIVNTLKTTGNDLAFGSAMYFESLSASTQIFTDKVAGTMSEWTATVGTTTGNLSTLVSLNFNWRPASSPSENSCKTDLNGNGTRFLFSLQVSATQEGVSTPSDLVPQIHLQIGTPGVSFFPVGIDYDITSQFTLVHGTYSSNTNNVKLIDGSNMVLPMGTNIPFIMLFHDTLSRPDETTYFCNAQDFESRNTTCKCPLGTNPTLNGYCDSFCGTAILPPPQSQGTCYCPILGMRPNSNGVCEYGQYPTPIPVQCHNTNESDTTIGIPTAPARCLCPQGSNFYATDYQNGTCPGWCTSAAPQAPGCLCENQDFCRDLPPIPPADNCTQTDLPPGTYQCDNGTIIVIIVNINVTVGGPLVLPGNTSITPGAQLRVLGCLQLNGTLRFTESPTTDRLLIATSDTDCIRGDFDSIIVDEDLPIECRRKASLDKTASSVFVVFSPPTKDCHSNLLIPWWAILIICVGGLLLIFFVIAILVCTVPAVRHFFRPYSKQRNTIAM